MRITDEPTEADDAELLAKCLSELRALDRDVVTELSTELTMGAARLNPVHPEKAKAMHALARIAYAVSHEVKPAGDA